MPHDLRNPGGKSPTSTAGTEKIDMKGFRPVTPYSDRNKSSLVTWSVIFLIAAILITLFLVFGLPAK